MSPNGRRVPLYSADNELRAWIPQRRAVQLERDGIARVVRHKKGYINRCILHFRPGDPKPIEPRQHQGTRYSVRQKLDNNVRCWKLKQLSRGDELRPIFLQVVSDCVAPNSARARPAEVG